MIHTFSRPLLVALLLAPLAAPAQTTQPLGNAAAVTSAPLAQPVVASGAVPDEATKAAVLARLRELYGADRVVDRIEVDTVVAPPNWKQHVVNMLGDDLRQVSAGQLEINGNAVKISGQTASGAQRQQVVEGLASRLNASYSIDPSKLKGGDGTKQAVLDQALADRIIEFQSGSATLTPAGTAILDQMAAAMKQIGSAKVMVIGHTDSQGNRQKNVDLSMARAIAVKNYLESSGVAPGNLSVQGLGPDVPVADNATPDGRARNRRIEFRVM